jgi:BMFP domain-containing protein YqiC
MSDRPRFFDDLAGVAGGAISALAGLRQEAEALIRTGIDDAIRRLDLVRREEFDVTAELAAKAVAAQEASTGEVAELSRRLAVLEARIVALEAVQPPND